MADIFISYAHEDQPFVRRMVPALEAEGFSVWWDHSIPPGQSWDTFIAAGIKEAKAAIVVWSPHSANSDWVKEEATLARGGAKYLPIQIGGAEPPMGFQRIQAAQLSAWEGDPNDPQWRMLLRAAHALIGGERSQVIAAPGAARPSYHPPPPTPPPAKSSASPAILIGIVALIAAAGLGWWFMGRGSEHLAETATTRAPVETSDVAPGPDPTQQAEVERLRRERDEALAWQQESQNTLASQQAENERLRREREQALAAQRASDQRAADQIAAARRVAEQAALAPVGVWSGTAYWGGLAPMSVTWTLSQDGTATAGQGDHGTWSVAGNEVTIILSGGNDDNRTNTGIFTGRLSGDSIRGTARTTASSHTGTFVLTR